MAIDQMVKSPLASGLGPLQGLDQTKNSNPGVNGPGSTEFKKALEQAALSSSVNAPIAKAGMPNPNALKFSGHAIERMHSRGIAITPEAMRSIENAVSKAAAKGAKDTLVLSGDNALIVNVKNKTVVTIMDREAMKDNVFTNIDSTVVV